MKKFEEYLSEKYITKEEMLDVLSDAVPYSDIFKRKRGGDGRVYRFYACTKPFDR